MYQKLLVNNSRLTSTLHPSFPLAPDPMSCCGSGCQNCVWIQYADDVSKFLDKHGCDDMTADKKYDLIKQELDRHVEDPNLRAYLTMELKAKIS